MMAWVSALAYLSFWDCWTGWYLQLSVGIRSLLQILAWNWALARLAKSELQYWPLRLHDLSGRYLALQGLCLAERYLLQIFGFERHWLTCRCLASVRFANLLCFMLIFLPVEFAHSAPVGEWSLKWHPLAGTGSKTAPHSPEIYGFGLRSGAACPREYLEPAWSGGKLVQESEMVIQSLGTGLR